MKAKKVAINIAFALLIVLTVFFAMFAVLAIKFRIKYQTNIVQQYSMVPTINKSLYLKYPNYNFYNTKTGDVAYVNKKSKINLGDVVVADVKSEPEPVVKRVVGMPGDKIRIAYSYNEQNELTYTLLVNETPLYTKPRYEYIGKNPNGEDVYLDSVNSYTYYKSFFIKPENKENINYNIKEDIDNNPNCYIILNENEYFLMGDNWNSSKDSLSFGAITKDEIVGKIVYVVDNYANKFWAVIKLMFKDVFNGSKKDTLEYVR